MGCFQVLVLLGLQVHRVLSAAENLLPLSIAPSQHWDGDDGLWSTFYVQVGTPGQTLRLLPSTSASAGTSTWAVIDPGCTDVNPTLEKCSDQRGFLFSSNKSTSWSTEGLSNGVDGAVYTLLTYEESLLGRKGNGSYGFDTVTLGVPGSSVPTLEHQVIAGIATNDFFLGYLGLSPMPFNFSSLNDPQPSLLGTLRNQSVIPSSSWAYTAGASYKSPPAFGSLTLGGFDTTRFEANSFSFAFGADQSRDLLLSLRSITYDTIGATPLLASSIDIFIDSLVPEIWLPGDVCDGFQQTFNLTWNEQAQIYLVSEQAHKALVDQNPEFTFSLRPSGGNSSSATSNDNVDIVLPYAAFDLNLNMPIVGNSTRWFPLKRAQNATQYTLGRTFLQEAYVVADYERRNFSVAQALFPASSVSQSLVAIEPPSKDDGSKAGLSAGAIAGIVVGVVVLLIGVAGGVWAWRRHKSRACATILPHERGSTAAFSPDGKQPGKGIVETDGFQVNEVDGSCFVKPELESGSCADGRHELPTQEKPHELSGRSAPPVELEAHVP